MSDRRVMTTEEIAAIPMTNQQRKAVAFLHREILLNDGLGDRFVDKYEYKEFSVEAQEPFKSILYRRDRKPRLIVVSCVGMKGDENTMASVFARRTRIIQVGPQGSLKLINPKRLKNGKLPKTYPTGRKVVWAQTDY